MVLPLSWHTINGKEGMVETIALSYSRGGKWLKSNENPTSKGVFIGFPI